MANETNGITIGRRRARATRTTAIVAMRFRRFYRRSRRLRRLLRGAKNAATYWLACFALWLPRRFTLSRSLALADRAGDLAYRLLGTTRRLALEHIAVAFGDDLPPQEREGIVRASFRNLARCFCELAHIETIRARLDEYVEVEGAEWLEGAYAEGRGVIAVTGHVGNWEPLAAYWALRGLSVAAVGRNFEDPRLDRLVVEFRAGQGVETIVRESPGASRQILATLKQGGVLAMLIDQDTRVQSVSVPFFGRPARTPAAAAVLALRREVPVIPLFISRRPEGGHRIRVHPPVERATSGDRSRDVQAMTRRFNEALEEGIRAHPAEWVWWHRRWRRAPVARLDLDADGG